MTPLNLPHAALEELVVKSRTASRKRALTLFRSSEKGNTPAIMLNAFQPGTYVRPHRHPMSDGKEIWIPLQGLIRVVVFDNDGNITESYQVTPLQTFYFEIPAETYHSAIAEQPDSVLIELYQGIYSRETYKDFPSWAPEEDTPSAQEYLTRLQQQISDISTQP